MIPAIASDYLSTGVFPCRSSWHDGRDSRGEDSTDSGLAPSSGQGTHVKGHLPKAQGPEGNIEKSTDFTHKHKKRARNISK